jgi:hypothetical protein
LVIYDILKDDCGIMLANSIGATLALAVKNSRLEVLMSQDASNTIQACSPKNPATKRTTTMTPMM